MELYVCTLIAALSKLGWRPIVLCVPGSKTDEFLREHGIETVPAAKSGYFNFADILRVRRLIRRRGVTVIHSHTRFDIWTASFAVRGFPRVKLFHSVYMNVAPKRDALHRWIYGRVEGIFSSSEIINKEITERYPVPVERVHLLRYGVEMREFINDESQRNTLRSALRIGADELLYGMMGRIDAQKGVREFAESYMLLPEEICDRVKYIIIGEPTLLRTESDGSHTYEPESEACDKNISAFIAKHALEKKILRVGFQKNFIPYLNAMDVFVLPSYAEMYSLSVIDAMAMGLPVIGTKAGGTEEQLAGGARGILIEPKSAASIARGVERYAAEPVLRAAHGAEGRKFAREQHSMANTIARLSGFYRGS